MPNVYSDTLTHDAVLVWLAPPSRDVVGSVQMRTAPPPVVGDEVPVTEDVTVQIGFAPAVSDDSPGTEAIALNLPLLPLVVDVAGPGESVEGRLGVLLPAVSDDRPPAEAVTLVLPLAGVSAVDALTPGEAVELRAALVVVDTIVLDDVAVIVLRPAPAVADVVPPTEAVAVALNVLTLSVADALAVGELASLLGNVVLQVADAITIDERRFATIVKPKKVRIRGRGAS